MKRELPTQLNDKPDFSNTEVMERAMTSDDEEQVEKVKAFLREKGVDEETIETSIALQRLRKEVHASQEHEQIQRVEENSTPTPEELSLGAYAEMIEPQVRDALFMIRKKGYNTVSSGFNDMNIQSIYFSERIADALSPQTIKKIEEVGAEVKENGISFSCDTTDLGKIKERWDAIAELLPERGIQAVNSPFPTAQDFRERYKRGELEKWYGRRNDKE